MLRSVTMLILLLGIVLPAGAQELYVLDNIPITLRAGQGTQYRIIAMISSEHALTRLEDGDGWTRIRTEKGDEGWVLTRYLTRQKPARLALAALEKEYAALQERSGDPEEELNRLRDENRHLQEQLSGLENTLQKLDREYETLQHESTDYLEVRSRLERLTAQYEEESQRAADCEAALSVIESRVHIYWFISGAGVLLLGFVLGLSMRRKNRRSSLLS